MAVLTEETLDNLEIYSGLTRSHADHVRTAWSKIKEKIPTVSDPEITHPEYQDVVICWGRDGDSAPYLRVVVRPDGALVWFFTGDDGSIGDGSYSKSVDRFGVHKAFFQYAKQHFCPPNSARTLSGSF